MKLKNVSELKGGEYLAKPVCIGKEIVLIYEGTCLKSEYIKKLKELGVQYVYVRDELNDDTEDDNSNTALKDHIAEDYREKVRELLERHIYTSRSELAELKNVAQNIIESIINEDEIVEQIENIREHKADIYDHSLNVCALSVLLALKCNLDMEAVNDIAVGSILHDIGFRYIPISYDNRTMENLTRKELVEYRKHSIYGYMAVEHENWLSEAAKEIILSHHERIDGSGYPIKNTDLRQSTIIVGLCDEFDTNLCGLCCNTMKPYQIIEHLKATRGIKFEASIMDMFFEIMAVYPVGTKVLTNEGETGIVVRQNNAFKERPVLRIIKDKYGNNMITSKEKDLLKYLNVFIEDVLE